MLILKKLTPKLNMGPFTKSHQIKFFSQFSNSVTSNSIFFHQKRMKKILQTSLLHLANTQQRMATRWSSDGNSNQPWGSHGHQEQQRSMHLQPSTLVGLVMIGSEKFVEAFYENHSRNQWIYFFFSERCRRIHFWEAFRKQHIEWNHISRAVCWGPVMFHLIQSCVTVKHLPSCLKTCLTSWPHKCQSK